MISTQKAIECAKTLAEFCKGQKSCQNCIFRMYGSDHWKCQLDMFDLQNVLSNIESKKKHGGYIG